MHRLIENGNEGTLGRELKVIALDERGPGGANHLYQIIKDGPDVAPLTIIKFQKGGVQEQGVNGISNEALLAIVADRLQGFMDGPYPSEETGEALNSVLHALSCLEKRTVERIERGVEGVQVA